ncbi:MAG: hypothetical protein PHX43_02170 [Alphaproteobacteria bacterium]|nr:hypothetical protein [Alphaproteobacteria bacterium]
MINNKAFSIRTLAQPRYILPTMIFMGVLMIGLRLEDMWSAASGGRTFHTVSRLQAATEEESKTESKAPDKEEGKPSAAKTEGVNDGSSDKALHNASEETVETDASILKQLKDRRNQLEQRMSDLDSREMLLKIAEQRVDQKMQEMETLRNQLQGLVNQASASQQAQLDNLVKIYETMKAKEAARIFEKLELPTLLGVIERMKPAKVAIIMAEMLPEKAKEITVALTKKDQLPQTK